MATEVTLLNGLDAEKLGRARENARADAASAERAPTVVAEWLGADHSRVRFKDLELEVRPPATLNPMQLLLASFAACDVDVIARRATLVGLTLEGLSVEASGKFNVRSYLGVDGADGSGYREIAYRIRVRAPGATAEQIAALRAAVEHGSPVGDSLERTIPLRLAFELSVDPEA